MSTMTLDTRFGSQHGSHGVRLTDSMRRSTLRLTRRGRLVIVAGALLVAFLIGVFVTAAGSVATQEGGNPDATRIVQVGSGETLWDIAAGLADDGEVRAMVTRIERLNALDSTVLQAGQRLVVPAE